jgi:RNA polymerase sigma-70 factor (ECF subfamily)
MRNVSTPQDCALRASDPVASAEMSDESLMVMMQSTLSRTTVDHVFNEIFRRYESRLAMWCSRLAHDPARGADLAQEVFLRAYRYRHTWRGDSRFSTWLYAIARNHCINTIRKLQSDPLGNADEFPAALPDGGEDVLAEAERSQRFERLWATMNGALTSTEKRVMVLHYGYDFSLAAITHGLMLSNPSGAKAYIVNARRKLRKALNGRREAMRAAA